ncbi:MAG TPA: FKBP-type peptidyl-prolyl cis-trans isomerase [Thermoanaerobaculia bacterium]|nr:FKBP-type peptidyl-prolyl cis-trans isomerase [Thermoanaerobaculia bacterium]
MNSHTGTEREVFMQETARQGDTVKVHYKGRLDDGSEFDSSTGRDPIEFTIGEQQVIQGFEQAVVGMSRGETKVQSIPADEAYGTRQDELVFEVPRSAVQPGMELSVGDMVQVHLPDGEAAPMQVAELNDDTMTLDANHPLAGKNLTFDLELVEIVHS